MAKIAVVTDSAACLPPKLRQELDIHQIAFELVWDGVIYRDGESLDPTEFYRRFRQSHSYPTTSQPPLGAFATLFTQLSEDYDGIVSIHVSGEMTGTVHTAHLAAEQIDGVPIRVLDSRTATIAQGFVVLAAARAAAGGGTLDQVVAAAERVIAKVDFFATLKTLEYIRRGGRLGEAAVLLGNQLRIVPLLNLKRGRVSIVGLTRSWKHALDEIVNLTATRLKGRRIVHASAFHADALPDAEYVRDQLCAGIQCSESYLTEFTPVMGAHTGPGVVGIAFYADD